MMEMMLLTSIKLPVDAGKSISHSSCRLRYADKNADASILHFEIFTQNHRTYQGACKEKTHLIQKHVAYLAKSNRCVLKFMKQLAQ